MWNVGLRGVFWAIESLSLSGPAPSSPFHKLIKFHLLDFPALVLAWEAVPVTVCSVSHFQVEFSMLNGQLFFSCEPISLSVSVVFFFFFLLHPVSILCILSSMLEACSQIPFRLPSLGSFLIQSAERGQATYPITHPCCSSLYLFPFQFIFSERWSVEL